MIFVFLLLVVKISVLRGLVSDWTGSETKWLGTVEVGSSGSRHVQMQYSRRVVHSVL
jgi:hypothetical protein